MNCHSSLAAQVKVKEKWSTPQSRDYKNPDSEETGNSQRKTEEGWTIDLNSQVTMKSWGTPRSSEFKNPSAKGSKAQKKRLDAKYLTDQVTETDGQLDQDKSNMIGKSHGLSRGRLNGAWVFQLMGTTLEKTFFVPLATQWLSKPQK